MLLFLPVGTKQPASPLCSLHVGPLAHRILAYQAGAFIHPCGLMLHIIACDRACEEYMVHHSALLFAAGFVK